MVTEQLLNIAIYLLGCFPNLSPEAAAAIAQAALDAAEEAAKDNRPTPPGVGPGGTADTGAHWAKRQGQAE